MEELSIEGIYRAFGYNGTLEIFENHKVNAKLEDGITVGGNWDFGKDNETLIVTFSAFGIENTLRFKVMVVGNSVMLRAENGDRLWIKQ